MAKETSIISKVERHVIERGTAPAIIDGERVITYKELWKYTMASAIKLLALGIQANDRVILSAESSPGFIFGYLATHLIQAISVPVDPTIPQTNLDYIIKRVAPKAVFVHNTRHKNYKDFRVISELDTMNANVDFPFIPPMPDQTADILFTSGTTGKPKGVVLTHANIFGIATNINTVIGNSSKDKEVVPLPLSHSFGLGRLRCNLCAGGSIILIKGFTFATRIFRALEQWNATGFSAVPAGFALLFHLTKDKFGEYASQLKYVEIGSAPMPIKHKKQLTRLLPRTKIYMHYGLTEASRSAFIEFHSAGKRLEGSIGKESPNVSIKITNKNYKEMPPGRKGKILVSGNNVMKEYHNDKLQTDKTIVDGWLITGDYGYMDEKGFIYLDGREKEMINIGGLKVSPLEVEEQLKTHKAVADCACVGIPDPKGISGEVPKAFIVYNKNYPNRPIDIELTDFLRDKLESYKLPVEFEWIDSVPKTTSGKIQRLSLKLNKGR